MEGALPDLCLTLSDKKLEQIIKVHRRGHFDCIVAILSLDCTEHSCTPSSG